MGRFLGSFRTKRLQGVRTSACVETLERRCLLSTMFVDVHNTSGVENGSALHPYHLIQSAIEATKAPGDVVSVGNGVTIDGLTIDGHNAAITTGGATLNGVSVNASSGVSNVDQLGTLFRIAGLTVQNNVIKNFTKFGVLGDGDDYLTSTPFVSSGNVIRNNNIDNVPAVDTAPIGTFLQGRGISIEDNFYASVTGNVITRAATEFRDCSKVTGRFWLDPRNQPWDRGVRRFWANWES